MIKDNSQLKIQPVYNWFSRYATEEDNTQTSTHFPKQITTQSASLRYKENVEKIALQKLTVRFE